MTDRHVEPPEIPAGEMFLKIHGVDHIKTHYTSLEDCRPFSGQIHWQNGKDAVINHTHNELPHMPIWAELGNQTIKLPVAIQLFHTDGQILLAEGTLFGPFGQHHFPVMLEQWPVVGDPNGVVKVNGYMEVNLADGLYVGVPAHGWTIVRFFTRTILKNGDQFDNEMIFPVFSVIDPSQPEVPVGGDGIQLIIKGSNTLFHNASGPIFGSHLTEFRNQDLAKVIFTPVVKPEAIEVFGYNYSTDPGLNTVPNGQKYTMVINPDLHMGVPGVLNDSLLSVPKVGGGSSNIDYIDPLKISKITPVMGFPPNQHRLSFDWEVNTGETGFMTERGVLQPPFLMIKSLMNVNIVVGENPEGCTEETCPRTGIPPVQPPVNQPLVMGECPGEIHQVATTPNGGFVTIPIPSVSGGVPPVIGPVATPSTGIFPVGTTPVVIIATDAAGNSVHCGLNVVMSPMPNEPEWNDLVNYKFQDHKDGHRLRVVRMDGHWYELDVKSEG